MWLKSDIRGRPDINVMDLSIDKGVYIKNEYVEKMVVKHIDNECFKKSLIELMEMYCRNYDDMLNNHSKDEECNRMSDNIIGYIKGLEDKLQRRGDESTEKISELIRVQNEDGKERWSKMLLSTTELICKSIDKLNVETISDNLMNGLKGNIENVMRGSKLDLDEGLLKCQTFMREEMSNTTGSMSTLINSALIEIKRICIEETNVDFIGDLVEEMLNKLVDKSNTMIEKIVEVERTVSSRVIKSIQKLDEGKEMEKMHHTRLINDIKSLPMLTKGVISDSLRVITEQNERLRNAHEDIKGISKEVKQLNMIKDQTDNVCKKIEDVEKQLITKTVKEDNNVRMKGIEGEKRILDGLSEKLMYRDGYTVESVSGYAHMCDIVVKRTNNPLIRIESKAYQDKVKSSEVTKFCRDLNETKDHGIFVSLHSGIVGRGDKEIQQLASGKFAIYLSNNNYNIDEIISMIHLIYKLDEIVKKHSDDKDTFKVSVDTLRNIKKYILDCNNNIADTIQHLKISITMLSNLDLTRLENMILGNQVISTPKPKETAVVNENKKDKCEYCGKEMNKTSLKGHKSICKMNKP